MKGLTLQLTSVIKKTTGNLQFSWRKLLKTAYVSKGKVEVYEALQLFAKCRIHIRFRGCLKVIGEGNGTPLRYSCLEDPMDGGAWWAVVHGVAKSRT